MICSGLPKDTHTASNEIFNLIYPVYVYAYTSRTHVITCILHISYLYVCVYFCFIVSL